jgi:hypothetical protein
VVSTLTSPIATPPRTVRGYVDDAVFDTILAEALEWVPDLVWPLSVTTYNMMRRDSRLAAVIDGYTLQLRRSQWQLDGVGCRPEVVQLVADDLGLPFAAKDEPGPARLRGVSWNEHLRVALTMLPFGHSGFEADVDVSSGQARLVGLYERPQWTISHLHVDGKTGELKGVSQDAAWREDSPQIKANALVWYAHEREGAGWQGTSLLRSAYAPWLIKKEMIRVHAISNRRWGAGVPVAEAIPGTSPTPGQMAEAQRMASAARAGDQAGASMPPNFTLKIAGLSGSVPDTLGFLEWLNREMAQAALMPHLDLGQGSNGGSRALGTAFIDSWTLALEAIGEHVADTATRQVAAKLVGWNWGADEPVPRVVVSGVGSKREVTAESLQLLLSSGALDADPALKAWIRREYRLPEQDGPVAPAKTATRGLPGQAREDANGDDTQPADVRAAALEPPVDSQQLQDDYEQAVEEAKTAWEQAAGPLIAALAAATAAEVAAGMLVGLGSLALAPSVTVGLTSAVTAVMLRLAQRTARQTAQVLPGAVPQLPATAADRVRQLAQATTDLIVSGYTSGAARVALAQAGPDADVARIEQAVAEHLTGLSQVKDSGLVADRLAAGMSTVQGVSLLAVYEGLPADTRYVANEINDSNRCKPCADVDGHEYDTLADAAVDYPNGARYIRCLGLDRCRGVIFPILARGGGRA